MSQPIECPNCQAHVAEASDRCQVCGETVNTVAGGGARRPSASLVGRVVNGKYKVLASLGKGGMGVVYKVQHLLLRKNNLFALKVLHTRYSEDPEFRSRFLREAEMVMELTHENIVQIRDFGLTEENRLFFTMDYFDGERLDHVLQRKGAVPWRAALRIARRVLFALIEAHRVGVVHRDLKPENLLVQEQSNGTFRLRVLDFGIAKMLADDSAEANLTKGAVLGTPAYMSPEQAAGEAIDARSDLYSLGVLLYRMLTSSVPFRGATTAVLVSHLTAPPSPFAVVNPNAKVPSRVEALVQRLLEKKPDDRYRSAEETLTAIERLLELKAQGTEAVTVRRESVRVKPAAAPRRRRVALLAAVALMMTGAASFPFWKEYLPPVIAEAFRPSGNADGTRSGTSTSPAKIRKFRCDYCGRTYNDGETDGNMCHGSPMSEVEE